MDETTEFGRARLDQVTGTSGFSIFESAMCCFSVPLAGIPHCCGILKAGHPVQRDFNSWRRTAMREAFCVSSATSNKRSCIQKGTVPLQTALTTSKTQYYFLEAALVPPLKRNIAFFSGNYSKKAVVPSSTRSHAFQNAILLSGRGTSMRVG
jgi:hypothetical protein